MHAVLRLLREACIRIESRSCLPNVRVAKDRETPVEVRHGQVFDLAVRGRVERFGMRRLFVLILCRL